MTPKISTSHLFRPLDQKLVELLHELGDGDWQKQTVAKAWKVKDVVSHLLDGNIKALSIQRDGYFGDSPPQVDGYEALVNWLNKVNADWVRATKRISPTILIKLHELTGPMTSSYFESVKPFDEAVFPVSWAGEEKSLAWMHIAREYTEKWHHQQQIRDATGKPGILTKEFFYPVMDTFFQALPHTFQDVAAASGTTIKVTIESEVGGSWFLQKTNKNWKLVNTSDASELTSQISISADISWKLFSKSLRPDDIMDQVTIKGDADLGARVLEMVSVMA